MRAAWLLGAALLASCATTGGSAAARPASGLPDFELDTVDGQRVRLSDTVGTGVVVLAFWATWCEPCKAGLPQLEKIAQRHQAQGLKIIGIAMDDATTVAQVAPFVRRSHFSFPVLLDTAGVAANRYNSNKSAPFTVVIDRAGAIAQERSGYEPGEEVALEQKLVELLGAGAPTVSP